ncbi:tRNA (guanine-N(7)-)-methyltransferase (tRNA(m7G46)-methyltransferase) [Tieghemiomyces parasiticus]|uniref:tRNA (Guanine-N(7)-)-methyltransferase (tRNA(m7G46)-methyltransferase) n=1 Tax=Tieghemiomyces parasiticus TaxID=78921 RepID=A0A9W8DQB2_9FUNG|nr:tRNA (guanine-N(7)-)-methyltransferase (tRNA(m7G46)-methyltransferase) [Tieghemiomyces parasiticus]
MVPGESWFAPSHEKAAWDALVFEYYHSKHRHPALRTAPTPSPAATDITGDGEAIWPAPRVSLAYLRRLVSRVLPLICPPNTLDSRLQALTIRELMAGAILRPVCTALIDPDTWNLQVDQFLTRAIEEQNMVAQLRRALNEQSTPVDLLGPTAQTAPGNLTTMAARLQGAASHALAHALPFSTRSSVRDAPSFDRFIESIKHCRNLEEVKQVRNQIVAQIRTKRILVEGKAASDIVHGDRVKDLHVYINRLVVAKRLAEKRILALGREVYQKDRYSSYFLTLEGGAPATTSLATRALPGTSGPAHPYPTSPRLSFHDILSNHTALSYFTEYMDLIGKVIDLQFWLTVEGLKRHPHSTDRPGLATVLHAIYRTYFATDTVDELDLAAEIDADLRARLALFHRSHPTPEEDAPSTLPATVTQDSDAESLAARSQDLFELVISAQYDVFQYMKENYYPLFLRSGLYYRFLTAYAPHGPDALPSPSLNGSVTAPITIGSVPTTPQTRPTSVHPSDATSVRSLGTHRLGRSPSISSSTMSRGLRAGSITTTRPPDLLGRLRGTVPAGDKSLASTTLSAATVSIQSSAALPSVEPELRSGSTKSATPSLVDRLMLGDRRSRPSLLSPVPPRREPSIQHTVVTSPAPDSLLSSEPRQSPMSSHSRSDAEHEVPPEPIDIPEADLLPTGAVEAVEAALSSIIQSNRGQGSGAPGPSATRNSEGAEAQLDERSFADGSGSTPVTPTPGSPLHPPPSSASLLQGTYDIVSSYARWWPHAKDVESDTAKRPSLLAQILPNLGTNASQTDPETLPPAESPVVPPAATDGHPAGPCGKGEDSTSDDDLDGRSSGVPASPTADHVHYAPPGDLLLPAKVAQIAQDLDRKRQQSAIVMTLIAKADQLGKANELRILRRSQSALAREIQLLAYQKQQYERQAAENVIVPGSTRIAIPSCTRGFARARSATDGEPGGSLPCTTPETEADTDDLAVTAYTLYLIEVQQMASDGDYDTGWMVARRYREFSALHQQLRQRFPVVRTYDFPRKHHLPTLTQIWPLGPGATGGSGTRKGRPWPAHVESRREALERYLQNVTRHEEVCHSYELRRFLSQQQPELDLGTAPTAPPCTAGGSSPGSRGSLRTDSPVPAMTRARPRAGTTGTRHRSGSGTFKHARHRSGSTSSPRRPRRREQRVTIDPTETPLQNLAIPKKPLLLQSPSTPGRPSAPSLTFSSAPLPASAVRDPAGFLPPIQQTIADGLVDLLGGPFMLDLVSQQLGREVASLTDSSVTLPTGSVTAPAGASATGATSFTDPLCDLVLEIFELKERSNWLRKRAITLLLRNVLGGTIERRLRDALDGVLGQGPLVHYLGILHRTFWPDNAAPFTPPAPRSDAEKFEARSTAAAKWLFFVPSLVGNMVGRRNARRGASRLFNLLQNPYLNENLVYHILDEVVLHLFPELQGLESVTLPMNHGTQAF